MVALFGLFIFGYAGPVSAKCLTADADADRQYGPLFTVTAERPVTSTDKRSAAVALATVRATLHHFARRGIALASGYNYDRGVEWGTYKMVPRDPDASPQQAPTDLRLPAGLLYTLPSSSNSTSMLVGAVYTAESNTTGDSLNNIIPLSVARWVRVHPRCSMPGPDVWTLEAFPFEKPRFNWQVPTKETYTSSYVLPTLPVLQRFW